MAQQAGTEVGRVITSAPTKQRNYCFTAFNNEVEWNESSMKYLIIGKETCPTTGRAHDQGFVIWKNARYEKALWKEYPNVTIKQCRGSIEDNIKYCSKEGNFQQWGEPPKGQGHRSDQERMVDRIAEGATDREIAEEFGDKWIRNYKGIREFRKVVYPVEPRKEKPYIEWRWGLAGTGKTRGAYEKHQHSVYIKDGTQWWDNYNQEEAIIIDDFDGRWPYRDLLRLLDRYPYQGQYKGGYVHITSPYIYITCEHPPQEFWSGNEFAQITRRIDNIIKIE